MAGISRSIARTDSTQATSPSVELVIPVHNEQQCLERTVATTRAFLDESFAYPTVITIVDNASTDETWQIAAHLARHVPGVRARHLDRKGRGLALSTAWAEAAGRATVLAYMDVDLSTDLHSLTPLIASLVTGRADIAIGTRLNRASQVQRGARRELISRSYNLLLHGLLGARFSDAQCGFKAITATAARVLLPHVQDTQWFFDTELLTLAQRAGLRIHEVPVAWIDDPDSRVDIPVTAAQDLAGILRLRHDLARRRIPLDAISEAVAQSRSVQDASLTQAVPVASPAAHAEHRRSA